MRSALVTALASWGYALQSEVERRASFLLQMTMMIVNDVIFIVFWFLVFSHKESIRGWDRDEVLVLFAVFSVASGVGLGLANGVRRLGDRIAQEDIDVYLVQPQPVVLRVITSRISPAVLGDVVFGIVLFALLGVHPWDAWIRFLVVSIGAGSMLVAFALAWESIAFWSRSGGQVANVAMNSMFVMGTYPVSFFPGAIKLIMFTAVPAALIASVPADFVLEPTWTDLGVLVGGFVALWSIGVAVFQAGLRRYQRAS